MNRIIRYLGTEYKFDYQTAISKLEIAFPMESFTEETENTPTENIASTKIRDLRKL